MVKNAKKWLKIENNCKISEITKYGEKMQTNDKNVKQCKKHAKNGPKTHRKLPNFGNLFFIVFLARNYLQKWY